MLERRYLGTYFAALRSDTLLLLDRIEGTVISLGFRGRLQYIPLRSY